jgi:opacity protein-like surface antigen
VKHFRARTRTAPWPAPCIEVTPGRLSWLRYVMTRTVLALVALLFSATPLALAAQQSARVSGVVRDGQLRPLNGVEVALAMRERTRTAFTNERGEFQFDSLPSGRALVIPKLSGYGATRRYELDLKPASRHEVEVMLYLRRGVVDEDFFDPDFNRPVDFSEPRGFSVALIGNQSTSTLAIGGARAAGTASAFRGELGVEFDRHWMFGVRGGASFGETSKDVNFPFNANNTFTYRDYRTLRLDALVRFSPVRNDRRLRPYASGSFGLSKFSGDVRVTNLTSAAHARGSGMVLTIGGGVQVGLQRNLALDLGAEWSGTSFEEWRINDGVIGLPNLRVFGTDFIAAIRWWPRAR